MVLLPIGSLRRSISPGYGQYSGLTMAGVCEERKAVDANSTLEASWTMRHAELHEVLQLDETGPILGEGASGTVWSCTLRTCGGAAAVKVVPKGGRGGAEAARHARHEAEVLRSLQHPNICKLLDAFEDDRNVYLVLEHVDGGDLFEALERNQFAKLDERCVAALAKQVFEALRRCHDASLIHRDIKPENVMLTSGSAAVPTVKLIDFGLAGRVCDQGDPLLADVAGTEAYMAPESLTNGIYSPASDMWSAGVLLHVLLAGALPSGHGVVDAGDMSESARDMLRCLLQHGPSARLTAKEAGEHPWLLHASRADTEEVAQQIAAHEGGH